MVAVLEEILNYLLRLDPPTLQALGELDGKVIRVGLTLEQGSPMELWMLPSASGMRLQADYQGAADVTIHGDMGAFTRLFFKKAASPSGDWQISGDVELGQRFQRIFMDIDIDWEEPLARCLGDVSAHQLMRLLRAAREYSWYAARTLAQDLAEYLQEESRLLARRERIEEFLQAVDRLRADAERLDKRVERLRGEL